MHTIFHLIEIFDDIWYSMQDKGVRWFLFESY